MTDEPPFTTYLVKQLESAIRARLDTALRRHGITTSQYTALTVLQHRGDLSSAQLSRRSFVRPQTMHELVVGLERLGLVARHASAERRHVLLTRLTPAGLAKLAECRVDVDVVERDMTHGLTDAELDQVRRLLERCHHALAHPAGEVAAGATRAPTDD